MTTKALVIVFVALSMVMLRVSKNAFLSAFLVPVIWAS